MPEHLSLYEADPTVLLIFMLMRRGSVLVSTMKQVIEEIRDDAPAIAPQSSRDFGELDWARELREMLR